MVSPAPPPNLPLKSFSRTYADVELAGHSPNTPWWVTPLAIIGTIITLTVVFAFLVHWL